MIRKVTSADVTLNATKGIANFGMAYLECIVQTAGATILGLLGLSWKTPTEFLINLLQKYGITNALLKSLVTLFGTTTQTAGAILFILTFSSFTCLFASPPDLPAPMPSIAGKSADELRNEAKAKIGIDSFGKINFVMVGQTGSGKSSFINAFRNMSDTREPTYAPVDENECTDKIRAFTHPNIPHMVLWDTPGSGTIDHPAETYCNDKAIYAFDYILICTATRFIQFDLDVAKYAQEKNIPFSFIRTKTDQDLDNLRDRNPDIEMDEIKETYAANTHLRFDKELDKAGMSKKVPLFLINSKSLMNPVKYSEYILDEAKLLQHITTVVTERRYVPQA